LKNFTFLFLIIFIYSCSTKKNSFLNREYHKLNSKYNVLFNGYEALEIGKEVLYQNKTENFYEILDIEPITIKNEEYDKSSLIPSFKVAEEKAVKTIQKHSMRINGIQKNSQIAKAYLLLGKARYYDRRFFPAMEAFNFLLEQYSNEEVFVEAKIWREKTNLRLSNNNLALKNLLSLSKDLKSSSKFNSLLNSTISQGFLNLKNIDSAIVYLNKAIKSERNFKVNSRLTFIQAQLYENLGMKDSIKVVLADLIDKKRRIPKEIWIQSKIKLISYEDKKGTEKEIIKLKNLTEDIENENFKHFIFRALALLNKKKSKDSLYVYFLNRSLESLGIDNQTRKLNFRDLADYFFINNNFIKTGNFLDSLIKYESRNLNKNKLKREKKGIQLVIDNENLIKNIDSIIYISNLDYEDQKLFFKTALIKESMSTKQSNLNFKLNEDFYFYNSRLVTLGKNYFLDYWGDRPNTDNWNNYELIKNIKPNSKIAKNFNNEISFSKKIDEMIKKIPKDSLKLKKLIIDKNKSYLELGKIYKEKFNNYKLSSFNLKKLLKNNPTQIQKVDALYQLFSISLQRNDNEKEEYKNLILNDFPNSMYASIIKNKNYEISDQKKIYNRVVNLFNQQKFEDVIKSGQEALQFLIGSEYFSKMELLIANSLGRIEGVKSWRNHLTQIIKKLPSSEEAKHAKKIIKMLDAKEEEKIKYLKYKWVFKFIKSDDRIENLKIKFEDYIKKNKNLKWKVSKDIFDRKHIFLTIHLNQYITTKTMQRTLLDINFNSLPNNFVLLKSEYLKMQLNKTIDIKTKINLR
tara:strand:+ start:11700 stop:14102 length:2403 start_codon:yes stop_codon:yes gene_type:complete